MRKILAYIAFGLLLGLLMAAGILLAVSPARSQPITLLPTPAPANLTVDIFGEVVQPGVYQLSPGSRVKDGIEAAGGLTILADIAQINMAAEIFDGQKITVAAKGTVPSNPPTQTERSEPIEVTGLININTATLELLDTLPGIGPTKAREIITYRQKYGPFDKIEEIQEVSGIGPATFEAIRDLISVTGGP